ncbi:MAG: hypothetical protein LBE09_01925 [Christensenellaceae bacterium]|jgi:hypothetical protein|nr:hypothetical protein [Christensenellaceae bacterium]
MNCKLGIKTKQALLCPFAIFVFAIVALLCCNTSLPARATGGPTVESVRARVSDDSYSALLYYPQAPLTALTYGRDILIVVRTSDEGQVFAKFEIYKNTTADQYVKADEKIVSFSQGTATLQVSVSGLLRIYIIGLSATSLPQPASNSTEIILKSDVTPPPEPNIDVSEFNYYTNNPVSVPFNIVSDISTDGTTGSGIDYPRSLYKFMDSTGELVPQLSRNLTPEDSQTHIISGIDRNGTLIFLIYDIAGNLAEYTYPYTRHGHPDTDPPSIILSPSTGFAKSVLVTIGWSDVYDETPSLIKQYAFITASSSIVNTYTEPFTVTYETDVTIRAYYYTGGNQMYQEVKITNVDATPPDMSLVEESASVYCNLREAIPIYMRMRVTDVKSGIRRVYTLDGEELENVSGDIYSIPLLQRTTLIINAEDNAGNVGTTAFYSLSYDYATIEKYSALFTTLNSDDYSTQGWQAVISAIDALSSYLPNILADTGYIRSLTVKLDDAIKGVNNIAVRIADSGLLEIPGNIEFEFASDTFDMKLGASLKVLIGNVRESDSRLQEIKNTAIALSGNKKGAYVCSFSIWLEKSDGELPNITGNYSVKIGLPTGLKNCSLYVMTDIGLVRIVDVVESDGYFTTNLNMVGDFYITGTIDDDKTSAFIKVLPYILFGISGAVAILLVFIILKTRKRLPK